MTFDFKKASLFIGIPAYQRWIAQPTCDSLDAFLPHALQARLNFAKNVIADTDIAQARNELVARFRMAAMPTPQVSPIAGMPAKIVNEPVSHLLMVDDDISFAPTTILEMMALDVPVVAGIVPKRTLNWQAIHAAAARGVAAEDLMSQGLTYNIGLKTKKEGEKLDIDIAKDGTVLCDRVGTAFLLVKREVFDAIDARCPAELRSHFEYLSSGERMGPEDTGVRFNYFQRGLYGDVENGRGSYMGEDFFFSELCLQNDIPVRAYVPAKFGHFGQFLYEGNPLASAVAKK